MCVRVITQVRLAAAVLLCVVTWSTGEVLSEAAEWSRQYDKDDDDE